MSSNINNSTVRFLNINQVFKTLDANKDNYITEDEIKNIFASSSYTLSNQNAKDILAGYDTDDDELLEFVEFNQLFSDLDVDKNNKLTDEEYSIIKKRMADTKKLDDLNSQYNIVNSPFATKAQKEQAKFEIKIIKQERAVTKSEVEVIKNQSKINDKASTISEDQAALTDPDITIAEQKKLNKEIKTLQSSLDSLILNRNIAITQLEVDKAKLNLLNKAKEYELTSVPETPVSVSNPPESEEELELSSLLVIQKGYETLLLNAQNDLEIYNKNAEIEKNQALIKKFYIPEFKKEDYRNQINNLQLEINYLNQSNIVNNSSLNLFSSVLEYYDLYNTGNSEELTAKAVELQKAEKETEINYYQLQILDLENKIYRASNQTNQTLSSQSSINDYNSQIAELNQKITDIQAELALLG